MTSTCPPSAAFTYNESGKGQPCAFAHWSRSTLPRLAAASHTVPVCLSPLLKLCISWGTIVSAITARVMLGRRPHAFFQVVETGAKNRYCWSPTKSAKVEGSISIRDQRVGHECFLLGLRRAGVPRGIRDAVQQVRPSLREGRRQQGEILMRAEGARIRGMGWGRCIASHCCVNIHPTRTHRHALGIFKRENGEVRCVELIVVDAVLSGGGTTAFAVAQSMSGDTFTRCLMRSQTCGLVHPNARKYS